ncbi:MarR family transcriptional regulator [Streptococcus saliviloxodontae]|uniref:Carboxylesterase type B n=1 Tax=Streptococcus saliviloxodontae TaxID=1349416 RepID=A0ABS2PJ29_9STRE|nr:helix-turn-helix domain-containing protein [Streptococcus saliviloxodontae]MBM7635277.1 carboxylesterase type B [Streptococcus saliviloxodontae]
MTIEKTVSELAEILGVSRQAVNNRVKNLPDEDLEKNDKGVTVVKRSGLIKLEEIYKKTIFEDEPIDEETKQREVLEMLVDEKNSEITRLYEQLKAKDQQLSNMDEQLRVKDVQISEKDKQLDQQQQLTLAAMEDSKTLKIELDEAKAEFEEIQIKQEEEAKKGFFARLFGK